jgi:cytochrome P450
MALPGAAAVRGDIATPPSAGGVLANLSTGQRLPALAARIGARLAALWGQPFRFGAGSSPPPLGRDGGAGPRSRLPHRAVSSARMEAVNGPFILGMDRGVTLAHERAALYQALARVDLAAVRAGVAREATARTEASGGEIDVVGGYARRIAAHTARSLFGVSGPDEQAFMDVARAIFAHTFLNLSGDKEIEARALKAAGLMRGWLVDEIAARRSSGRFGTDMMGALLHGGLLDDDGVRRTLGGVLVGSIDTTASTVAKIVAVIGHDRRLAERVAADVDDEPRLAGWCREALRRWPHNPILLRRAVADTRLAGVDIRGGDQIVAWTQAAMLDPSAFPDPQQLRPDRPVAAYLHFGGGLHPCAGRAVNAFQVPLLVGALVRRGIKSVGPMRWAGPFPDHLALRFER